MASVLVKIEGSYYPRTVVEAALSAEPVPTFNPGDIVRLTRQGRLRYQSKFHYKHFMVLGPEVNAKLGGCLKSAVPVGFVRVLDGTRTLMFPADYLNRALAQTQEPV